MNSKISPRTLRWTTLGAVSALALAFSLGTAQPAAAMNMAQGDRAMPNVVFPAPSIPDTQAMAADLADEGFTHVANVTNSGNIYHATANWGGKLVSLRINGLTGSISGE